MQTPGVAERCWYARSKCLKALTRRVSDGFANHNDRNEELAALAACRSSTRPNCLNLLPDGVDEGIRTPNNRNHKAHVRVLHPEKSSTCYPQRRPKTVRDKHSNTKLSTVEMVPTLRLQFWVAHESYGSPKLASEGGTDDLLPYLTSLEAGAAG